MRFCLLEEEDLPTERLSLDEHAINLLTEDINVSLFAIDDVLLFRLKIIHLSFLFTKTAIINERCYSYLAKSPTAFYVELYIYTYA